MVNPGTRDRLVETARQLFWRLGYHSTGIAQILEDADVRSGSLYHYFPTKEDLLHAVLDQYLTLLKPRVLAPIFQRVKDPIERIFGILDGYRRQLEATKFIHGCPIGSLALELAHTHPEARRLIVKNFDAWRRAVEECLREASGRLPPRTDISSLALFVLVTMEGAVMLSRTYRSLEPFDAAIGCLRGQFDSLIREGTDWRKRRSSKAARKMTEGHAR